MSVRSNLVAGEEQSAPRLLYARGLDSRFCLRAGKVCAGGGETGIGVEPRTLPPFSDDVCYAGGSPQSGIFSSSPSRRADW